MAKIVDKVLGFMGFEEVPDEEEKRYEEQQVEEVPINRNNRKGAVVSLHTQRQVHVVVVEPGTYDEVQGIADHLKNRRPVIVNLENAEVDLAKRVVDFMSGTTYALNGSMQKVGNGIFLFVPNNMDITAEIKDQNKDKGFLSWMRGDREAK
ncbi:cell division protein SepF [Desulfolucanica intricata]|uniref:cell division protein SepF n=1 Tax=Desulfolucanica intricata TaxID=1285191 RepID=UPI0008379441|nr:cell division protein SepF [Desulfolucanica intricata]